MQRPPPAPVVSNAAGQSAGAWMSRTCSRSGSRRVFAELPAGARAQAIAFSPRHGRCRGARPRSPMLIVPSRGHGIYGQGRSCEPISKWRIAGPSAAAPADDAAHLLIVDDDRRIRMLLSRMLSEEGYRVTAAADAEEAMARLKSLSFDLIVLDVMMPGEDGFAFAARLRGERIGPCPRPHPDADRAQRSGRPRAWAWRAASTIISASRCEPRELTLRIASILRRAPPRAHLRAARLCALWRFQLRSWPWRTAPSR